MITSLYTLPNIRMITTPCSNCHYLLLPTNNSCNSQIHWIWSRTYMSMTLGSFIGEVVLIPLKRFIMLLWANQALLLLSHGSGTCCLPKHKFFCWLMLHDRVNTCDLLSRKKIPSGEYPMHTLPGQQHGGHNAFILWMLIQSKLLVEYWGEFFSVDSKESRSRNQNRRRTRLCLRNYLESTQNHGVFENHAKWTILAILGCPSKENDSFLQPTPL